jgi:hypothetical protein
MDLRGIEGGVKNDKVFDNVIQEIDIATGKVLFKWHSAKHIDPHKSYETIPHDKQFEYDYVHANSVTVTPDGNLLVSARAMHQYYKLNRKTGKIMWRMGGKDSDFKMGKGARTAFQHDTKFISKDRISVYDNNADLPVPGKQSRGVILKVDEKKRTVKLLRSFRHKPPLLGPSQGNLQVLPNGNAFIGWGGTVEYVTEFSPKGKIVWDGRFIATRTDSYRAYRGDWVGQPKDAPLGVASRSGDDTIVRMSWNGATEIKNWRVYAGEDAQSLKPVGSLVRWNNLETGMHTASLGPLFRVQALDSEDEVLGTSELFSLSE